MLIKNLLILLVLVMPFGSIAQQRDREVTEAGEEFPYIGQSFKINPLLFFTGDIPLFFEYLITEKTSIELGAGITTRNYMQEFWSETVQEDIDHSTRSSKMGYSLRVSPRFYLGTADVNMSGLYLAPGIQYRAYRSHALLCDPDFPGYYLEGSMGESRNTIDLNLMFGLNDVLVNNLIADYFAGLGVRRIIFNQVECEWDASSQSFITVINRKTSWMPAISLGAKLGIGR